MQKHVFRRPDNWHAHLRTDDLLRAVYEHFNIYGRVLCMGNTSPLIETASGAECYRRSIMNHSVLFDPVMCIMLTQDTTPSTIYEAAEAKIKFVKFIPVGTSTGAVKGLRLDDIWRLYKIFPAICDAGMHLLIHAELVSERSGKEIPMIMRERRAIPVIAEYHRRFPSMKITVEHASTASMIGFVKSCDSANVRATLTPHHAILTYRDVFDKNGRLINPFNYCLPVLKSEADRRAVAKAMVSGDERFFAGPDAAPHWAVQKIGDKPPAGIFFGTYEYLRYLQIFEQARAIRRLEPFTSQFGAEYYGYPLNKGTVAVVQKEWLQPTGEQGINFCLGGEPLGWRIVEIIR